MRRPAVPALALLAAGVLPAAGCGSTGAPTTGTLTEPAKSTPSPGTTATVTTPTAPVAGTHEPPPGPIVHRTTFRSPSGNIGCEMLDGEARCDISGRTWSPPPKPSTCTLDWGQGFTVRARGAGAFVCAGDTALNPSAPVLAYGTSSRVGGLTCTSRAAGMTCTNRDGHGFFLSRERGRLF
jgi:hypothetical protein